MKSFNKALSMIATVVLSAILPLTAIAETTDDEFKHDVGLQNHLYTAEASNNRN